MEAKRDPILSIIHFNDAYDIQTKYNKGGIVNFKAKVQQLRVQNPNSLLLFSGDALSPSILSNLKEGWQIVHGLNQLGIDAACYGNHEFDYPYEHTLKLAKECNFPWLLGNIVFSKDNTKLGDGKDFIVLEKNNKRVGIYGIAGQDWLGILSEFVQGQLKFIDHIEHSKKMCKILKQQQRCDIVIALTHMRNHPDLDYPLEVKQVDLVLGGHDHVILHEMIDKTPVIKSGSNFRHIGLIKIYQKNSDKQDLHEGRNYNFQYQVMDVQTVHPQHHYKQLENYVQTLMNEYKKFDEIVGYTQIDLQTRFSIHRTQQTPYGNFFADLMRLYLNTDVSFCNSGTIRNDCIIHQGPIKYSEISNIINDALVVLSLTGADIIKILEISVQSLPKTCKGSFMHVSGIKFSYSYQRPPGSRVIEVHINNQLIDISKKYTATFFSYVGRGNDGFAFLKKCQMLKDQVQTCSMLNLLQSFFHTLNQELIPQGTEKIPCKKRSNKMIRITNLQHKVVLGDHGHLFASIHPVVEGRIARIDQSQKLFSSVKEIQNVEQKEEFKTLALSSPSIEISIEVKARQ